MSRPITDEELQAARRSGRLELTSRGLTSLPPEITHLTNLQYLHLGGNQLTSLPTEIAQLTNLEALYLGGNQLTSLPMGLANMLGPLSLHIDKNPLDEAIVEAAGRGSTALAAYLLSLDDAVAQYEAKLLLLGEGNVGKTCLVAALRGEPFQVGLPTTHGIEISELSLPHPSVDTQMTIRAWDFGGQEVYRVTHQFFFSRPASRTRCRPQLRGSADRGSCRPLS